MLLLSASMLCERNVMFIERATKLDGLVQHHVKEMVEAVLQPNDKLAGLESSFYHILSKPLGRSPSPESIFPPMYNCSI